MGNSLPPPLKPNGFEYNMLNRGYTNINLFGLFVCGGAGQRPPPSNIRKERNQRFICFPNIFQNLISYLFDCVFMCLKCVTFQTHPRQKVSMYTHALFCFLVEIGCETGRSNARSESPNFTTILQAGTHGGATAALPSLLTLEEIPRSPFSTAHRRYCSTWVREHTRRCNCYGSPRQRTP